jgi:hypothetical protein
MTKDKCVQIGLSYLRAGAAAAAALYLAGETDPKTLCWAFVAAIAGPALKALDKTAKEFGRGSKK